MQTSFVHHFYFKLGRCFHLISFSFVETSLRFCFKGPLCYSTAIELSLFGPYLVSNTRFCLIIFAHVFLLFLILLVEFQAEQANAYLFQNACSIFVAILTRFQLYSRRFLLYVFEFNLRFRAVGRILFGR